MSCKIRYGMAGGGCGAFMGGVHRIVAAMDQQTELVCGAFSSNLQKSKDTGTDLFFHARMSTAPARIFVAPTGSLPMLWN
jgi:hypothetical protein